MSTFSYNFSGRNNKISFAGRPPVKSYFLKFYSTKLIPGFLFITLLACNVNPPQTHLGIDTDDFFHFDDFVSNYMYKKTEYASCNCTLLFVNFKRVY